MDVQKPMFNDEDLKGDNQRSTKELFGNQEESSDITLISADDEYRAMAHKKVLTSASKYFQAMFDGSLRESSAKEVKLSQIDGRTLKLILAFIYKKTIELTIDTVGPVFVGAHILELAALEIICCVYTLRNLNVSKCLGMAELAKLHNCDELQKAAMLYACEHFVALRDVDAFFSLSCDQLCELISKNDLRVPSEADVFYGIMAWIDHAKDDREAQLPRLLSYLRFPLLPQKFIKEIFEKFGESPEVSRILCKALICHVFPNLQATIYSHELRRVRHYDDVIIAVSGVNVSSADLSVGLYYSGLGEWIYTKWPGIPYQTHCFKYAVLNKKLIIASGAYGDNISNRVDCFNLETLQWEDFPWLHNSPVKALFKLKNRVYAIGDDFAQYIETNFNHWIPIEGCNDIASMGKYAVDGDVIYFTSPDYLCVFNMYEKFSNLKMIEHQFGYTGCECLGLHTMRRKNVDYLVVITTYAANVYDLATVKLLICNKLSIEDCDKTAMHNNKIIIYGRNVFYEYDVFLNKLRPLPNSIIDVDLLITNEIYENY